MKLLHTCLFILFCIAVHGQEIQKAEIALNGKLPAIYKVDGVLLNNKAAGYFADQDIAVKKVSNKGFPIRDTVYITLKDHKKLMKVLQLTKLTLAEIAAQNVAEVTSKSQLVYLKNDTLLTETKGVKISALRIFLTKVVRAAKTSYYDNFPDATFLYIYTKPVPFYVR